MVPTGPRRRACTGNSKTSKVQRLTHKSVAWYRGGSWIAAAGLGLTMCGSGGACCNRSVTDDFLIVECAYDHATTWMEVMRETLARNVDMEMNDG